jgi:hypothetical protein
MGFSQTYFARRHHGISLRIREVKINIAFKYVGSGKKNAALDGAFQVDECSDFWRLENFVIKNKMYLRLYLLYLYFIKYKLLLQKSTLIALVSLFIICFLFSDQQLNKLITQPKMRERDHRLSYG